MKNKVCCEGASRGLKTCLECPAKELCDETTIQHGASLLRTMDFYMNQTDWALKFAVLFDSFRIDNEKQPLNQKQRNDFHDCLCCIMKELQEINETAGTKA